MKIAQVLVLASLSIVAAGAADAKALNFGAGDIQSGIFGNANIAKGNFSDTLAFTLTSGMAEPLTFSLASSLTSAATKLKQPGDVDFTSVFITGAGGPYNFTIRNNDSADHLTDSATFTGLLDAGAYVLHVNGYSYGRGQYGGNTTATAAVPEVGSWMMMLAGFGGIGVAMRTRRKVAVSFG